MVDSLPILAAKKIVETAECLRRRIEECVLDYCSEMLSLVGKITALHGQNIPDSIALDSIDRVETLTTGLSRKIWKKLSMLRNP
jgi:hypothetical protein